MIIYFLNPTQTESNAGIVVLGFLGIIAAAIFGFLYINSYQQLKSSKATANNLQYQIQVLNHSLNRKAQELQTLNDSINTKAQEIYNAWASNQLNSIRTELRNSLQVEASANLQSWLTENETLIRQDAIERSRSVILGKVTEHLAPFMPTFPYNPKDVRFIGTPIDLLVFDGLDEGNLRDIVIIEVKTGNSSLTPKQKQIKDAILHQRIIWREWRN